MLFIVWFGADCRDELTLRVLPSRSRAETADLGLADDGKAREAGLLKTQSLK